MTLLAIQPLGRNRDHLRLWIESRRLEQLGFTHGTPLEIKSQPGGLTLRPAVLGENHVSSRVLPGGRRPIIDLANQSLLSSFEEYSALKIIASFEHIHVSPSQRAFAIQRSRTLAAPFRVLEVFAGGSTLTAALDANPHFQVVAGLEIEPDFADEWQARHPDATLVQANNMLLTIEHNLDVIKTADWIIDLGPEGGAGGGKTWPKTRRKKSSTAWPATRGII